MDTVARLLRKPWVFYTIICLPILCTFIPIVQGDTEYLADPAKYLLEYVGKTATILLLVVMAITPLRMLFPKASLVKAMSFWRRQIGIGVFAYAALHFLIYIPYTGSMDAFFADWNKLFILSGLVALALLFVLAITSNNWAIRKLTAKRWKLLHRLAYPTVLLAMYHQAAQEKSGYRETLIYFSPLIALECYRVIKLISERKKKNATD